MDKGSRNCSTCNSANQSCQKILFELHESCRRFEDTADIFAYWLHFCDQALESYDPDAEGPLNVAVLDANMASRIHDTVTIQTAAIPATANSLAIPAGAVQFQPWSADQCPPIRNKLYWRGVQLASDMTRAVGAAKESSSSA
ncbi:hypothetical protein LZ554_004717 [Drepanopeziza brunnea f. sp. 'monogermtubi']|nr:hypothetical protein LZ554_004717 [Drepanopeziza brunnea f. sp. 'monogermtubi']